ALPEQRCASDEAAPAPPVDNRTRELPRRPRRPAQGRRGSPSLTGRGWRSARGGTVDDGLERRRGAVRSRRAELGLGEVRQLAAARVQVRRFLGLGGLRGPL